METITMPMAGGALAAVVGIATIGAWYLGMLTPAPSSTTNAEAAPAANPTAATPLTTKNDERFSGFVANTVKGKISAQDVTNYHGNAQPKPAFQVVNDKRFKDGKVDNVGEIILGDKTNIGVGNANNVSLPVASLAPVSSTDQNSEAQQGHPGFTKITPAGAQPQTSGTFPGQGQTLGGR